MSITERPMDQVNYVYAFSSAECRHKKIKRCTDNPTDQVKYKKMLFAHLNIHKKIHPFIPLIKAE